MKFEEDPAVVEGILLDEDVSGITNDPKNVYKDEDGLDGYDTEIGFGLE